MTISVAPMEGVTTFPMRLWLHMCSQPEAMTSPFLRVTRAFPEDALPETFVPELLPLRGVLPYTLVPQYISGDPDSFLRAAEYLPALVAPFIELNCGCPSPNALGRFAGSGMLQDPEFFARTIERLAATLGPGRLAVKMRLGFADDAEFPALLQALVDLPLARLTVHARTRADGYRGQARWEAIQAAAARMIRPHTPVHASGDVLGIKTWRDLQTVAPDIAGAMVGRGLLRNPWVFAEIRDQKPTRMAPITFINALFCYLLLQDIFAQDPHRLFQKVSRGRLGSICGTDFGAWEKAVVECTALVCGVPFVLLRGEDLHGHRISPVAFQRLRYLWSYLRSGLPEVCADPALLKSKQPQEFFQRLLLIGATAPEDWTLTHQTAWDAQFAGQRG